MSKQMKSINKNGKRWAAVLGTLAMSLATPMAFAQTTSANSAAGVARNLSSQFPDIVDLFTRGAYVLGAIFLVTSLLKFRAHNEDARSTPLKTPVVLFLLGACFIVLPWISSVGQGTLGANGSKTSVSGSTEL